MRPLILTMQAFGPYAHKETIDFTRLGNRTMFVISGKTGSGKTTIFDGISYAIYGKASGEDRNGPELRSQFAKEDVLTEVSLQFSLKGKTYFIKRSPQQEKKKERGEGVRVIGAQAELYTFDEQGEKQLVASNVRDVDEKIKEIMLIDSNQFRQILMIPQGEFRKLLTSDSKDKEVILQRLFHTEIYKRIEDKLKEEATGLKNAVEKQMESRNQLIGKINAFHNEELKALLANKSVNDTVIMPLLKDEIGWMTQQLEKLSKEVKEKEENRDVLQQKLYEAENIVQQMKIRDELGERKTLLEAQKEKYEEKEREILLANKASLLAKQEDLCHRLKKELDGHHQDLNDREKRIKTLKVLLQEREEIWSKEKERENERKAAQEEVHRLKQMKDDVNSFTTLQGEVQQVANTLLAVKEERQQAGEELNKIEENIKNLTEQKQQYEKSEIGIIENERMIERLNNELELIVKYEQQKENHKKTSALLEKRKGEYNQAELRLKDARLLLEEIEQKWIHGQASIIASKLHEGEVCPVCGSQNHPNPARDFENHIPNETDLKAAKEQVTTIEIEKTRAESALFEVQSDVRSMEQGLTDLLKEIQGQRSDFLDENIEPYKNYMEDQRRDLLDKQVELKQGQLKLITINTELQTCEKNKDIIVKKVEMLIEKVNELTISFTEKNTSLSGMKNRIPEHLRSLQEYNKQFKLASHKQDELQKRFEKAQKDFQETRENFATEQASHSTVQKHAEDKQRELEVEREEFVQQMKKQGFESYGQYANAKRTDGQIQQLTNEIRSYREELRSVTDRFEELTNLLKDVKRPNLEELQQVLKELKDEIDKLNDQYTNLFIKRRDNQEIEAEIEKINKKMKALEDRYTLVGHLYEISKGQNTYRITFERFVLAAFLDDILREANGRLTKMTNGRYQMLRKTDRAKGNAQSGLELLVFDQYTGQERHVKTLSGGESFKAALSLALGLADVVQQYAGGVSLETMFIDEGFGTLDPESLDQAIEALIDIQSSGRLVGIISHVPELRERIDARLEVTATQTGSTVEFHFLNG